MSTILSFIVVIGIIVFVHELGHYLAAKMSGVRVETFSLGFPPKMLGHKIGETEYIIGWVPLGGYVKMSGMIDESFDESFDPNDPRGFMAQSFWSKVFIISAGVIMNVLLGWLLYSSLTYSEGVGRMTGTTLTLVSPDYPAAEAGLEVGDQIVAVAGERVEDWSHMTEAVRKSPGIPVEVEWLRGDSLMRTTITPRSAREFNLRTGAVDSVGKIGVVGTFTTERVGPLAAFVHGGEQVWWVIRLNVASVAALLSGTASVRELTGPLGIARMSGESARSGAASFIAFIALISISIAFLNILPVPMLDGGHLLFLVIESVIGREIPEKVKTMMMKVGLAMLLLLVAVVSYHDILRFYWR
ncbi:MAG: RIP metalloprotease RseP [Calditrichaeota bacterium]|nr:RIP metalloprotease RseP [Calditrichota bacterium]